MNYYLIDFENARIKDAADIPGLSAGDIVILFYSEGCKNISLDLVESITTKGARFLCQRIWNGTKNALDFQLSSYMGYLIGQSHDNEHFHIVSNDKGYDCLSDYWHGRKVTVVRDAYSVDIQQNQKNGSGPVVSVATPATPASVAPSTETAVKKVSKIADADITTLEEIKKYLSKGDAPTQVLSFFNKYKTKQAIYNAISKQFKDSRKSGEVYKKLKPLFKEKNKT